MPDADTFLRAVLEKPDDDAPRLIYADWLDENGDPERAEFIRLQCALAARQPVRGRDANPNFLAMLRREDQLLERHAATWQAPFESGRNLSLTFRRGFVENVVADAHTFVQIAEELFRRSPVRHLRLTWKDFEPHYERGRFLQTIAAVHQLAGLRSLDLGGCSIGSDGIRALSVCEFLSGLQSIDLCNNGIGRAGMRALTEASWFQNLAFLDLSRNEINSTAVRALAAGLEDRERAGSLRLQDLYLFENPLGQAGLRAIHASNVLRRVARL
jgi:uncharacterized protein (TIGR02996 family)